MTALALLALGLHDLLDAVLPGAWPAPRRRWLARAGAAVAAVLAVVFLGWTQAKTGTTLSAVVFVVAALALVGGLLALHDLHPVDVRTRVEHAVSAAKRSAA